VTEKTKNVVRVSALRRIEGAFADTLNAIDDARTDGSELTEFGVEALGRIEQELEALMRRFQRGFFDTRREEVE